MKNVIVLIALMLVDAIAIAANYTVSASWSDPTPVGANYSANYSGECRVNGGTATPINGLTTPAFSVQMTANQGDTIECRGRAINVVVPSAPVNGNWTAWFAAAAPISPRNPADQTNFSITVTPAN